MSSPLAIISPENLETFVLIWLDSLVNRSTDNVEAKVLLRRIINRLVTFDKMDDCIEYIENHDNERIVLMVSGRLGQETVPIIHDIPHLVAIYVYCLDKKRNEAWAKNFFKVNLI